MVALEGCQCLQTSARGTVPSFLRLAAIQGIKRKQAPADLARKGCFIAADAVERAVAQIGES